MLIVYILKFYINNFKISNLCYDYVYYFYIILEISCINLRVFLSQIIAYLYFWYVCCSVVSITKVWQMCIIIEENIYSILREKISIHIKQFKLRHIILLYIYIIYHYDFIIICLLSLVSLESLVMFWKLLFNIYKLNLNNG